MAEKKAVAKKTARKKKTSGKLAVPKLRKALWDKAQRLLEESLKTEEKQPEFETMPLVTIQEKAGRAIQQFLDTDGLLCALNVNERTLTYRIARCLEDEFPNHDVDCEYNRKGYNDTKWLEEYPNNTSTRDTTGTTAFPDIIIHCRTVELANLLVVEIKKSTNPQKDKRDKEKLEHLVKGNQYQYTAGLFLEITTGIDILEEDVIFARGYWITKADAEPKAMKVLARTKGTLPKPILEHLVRHGLTNH